MQKGVSVTTHRGGNLMASSGASPQSVKIQQGTGPLVDLLPFDNAEYHRWLDGVRKALKLGGVAGTYR